MDPRLSQYLHFTVLHAGQVTDDAGPDQFAVQPVLFFDKCPVLRIDVITVLRVLRRQITDLIVGAFLFSQVADRQQAEEGAIDDQR